MRFRGGARTNASLTVVSPHCGLRPRSTLGGEVYERELLLRLGEHGVRLLIGLPGSRPADPAPPSWDVSLLRPPRGLRWYVAPLAFVPFTVRRLRRGDVDLLRGHSVLFTGPSLFAARRLARADVPIVLQHLHTERPWTRLEDALLRRADAVLTISRHSRRQLLDAGVRDDRIHVVTPGIEVGPSEPGPDVAWPSDRGLRLLFLSSLIERKRPDLALRTLAAVRANGHPASLVIAGRGPLERRLRRLARSLGVADVVAWHAPTAEEKWPLFDSAHALLFPSRLEGFGLVVAEAQSRGLPAVVAEGTATEEIVDDGETGFVVPATADAFAAAVGRLVDGRVRAAFGERARIATARYDWERAAAQTAEILRDVASR